MNPRRIAIAVLCAAFAAWCLDAFLYHRFFCEGIPLPRCLAGRVPLDHLLDRLCIAGGASLFVLLAALLRGRVRRRESYLRCLAEISSDLLSSRDPWRVLPGVLAKLRAAAGADRCYMDEVRRGSSGAEFATLLLDEYAPGVPRLAADALFRDLDLRARGFGRWADELSAGRPIAGPACSLPATEREFLDRRGIQSILVLPLRWGGQWRGFIGFDARRRAVRWSAREIDLLCTAATAVSSAMDRAAREDAIAAARSEWESTFDSVPDLIAILDAGFRIRRVNRAMAERMGVSPARAEGMLCYEAVHGLAQHPDFCPHAKLLEDRKVHTIEVREPKLNGVFLVTVSPLFDRNGSLAGSVHVARDITAAKSLEEQLLRAQKMEAVGLLAGGVAHDFNNIMAGIMGYAALVKGDLPPGSPLIPDLQSIERLARRGGDLTDALLAFARKGEHRPEPLDLALLVREVLTLVGETAGRGVTVRESLPADLPSVVGDRGQLHQVFMNLFINACEAMPSRGTLRVSASAVSPSEEFFLSHPEVKRGAFVRVDVSDTGKGIAPELASRIFEPFFTTKSRKTGAGLGLPVAAGIMGRHGGCIEVAGGVGKGSTFTVFLPAGEGKAPPPPAAAGGEIRGTETVLLVDDEEDFRIALARGLEKLGYRTVQAPSGEEALALLAKGGRRPDIAILDMIMRGMGGAETFSRIREIAPELPVVICTGYSLDIGSLRLLKEGARDFLQKPFETAKLAGALRRVLDGGSEAK